MLCINTLNPIPQLAALNLCCCQNSAVLSSIPEQIEKIPSVTVNLVPYFYPLTEYGHSQLSINQNRLSVH